MKTHARRDGSRKNKVLCIRAGTLVDGRRRKPVKRVSIILAGNQIKSIKRGFSTPIPAGSFEIDARDEVVLPGFIDMHVHVKNERQLELFLKYGVTSIRDLGNNLRRIKSMSLRVKANRLIGPRIFYAGPLIDSVPERVRRNEFFPKMNIVVRDEKQAARVANRLMKQDVDCLKVYQNMREDMIRAVVKAAKKKGIPVAAHSGIGSTIGQAVRAGITTVEHVHRMATELAPKVAKKPGITGPYSMMHPWACVDLRSPEVRNLIQAISERRAYLDPTLTVIDKMGRTNDADLLGDPDYALLDPVEASGWKDDNKAFLENVHEEDFQEARFALKVAQGFVGRAFRSKVRILAGSDNGMPYSIAGKSLHEEMKLLSECGMPNIDVIRAATVNAASALNAESELGSVEEGKFADLVILKANPLDDIRNTLQISRVIKDGKIFDPSLVRLRSKLDINRAPQEQATGHT